MSEPSSRKKKSKEPAEDIVSNYEDDLLDTDDIKKSKRKANRTKGKKKRPVRKDVVIDMDEFEQDSLKISRSKSNKWDEGDLEVVFIDSEEELSKSETPSVSSFTDLPHEVLLTIISTLDRDTLIQLSSTCHALHETIWTGEIWKTRLEGLSETITRGLVFDSVSSSYEVKTMMLDAFREADRLQRAHDTNERELLEVYARRSRSEAFIRWYTILFLNRSMDYLTIISILLGGFFVMFKMEDLITFSWRLVILPFLIQIGRAHV